MNSKKIVIYTDKDLFYNSYKTIENNALFIPGYFNFARYKFIMSNFDSIDYVSNVIGVSSGSIEQRELFLFCKKISSNKLSDSSIDKSSILPIFSNANSDFNVLISNLLNRSMIYNYCTLFFESPEYYLGENENAEFINCLCNLNKYNVYSNVYTNSIKLIRMFRTCNVATVQ